MPDERLNALKRNSGGIRKKDKIIPNSPRENQSSRACLTSSLRLHLYTRASLSLRAAESCRHKAKYLPPATRKSPFTICPLGPVSLE